MHMSGPSRYVCKSAIGRWFESRLPLMGIVHSSFLAHTVPRNLNFMWTFGANLSFMLRWAGRRAAIAYR
jgi:ubiquinol-cytochrome c reductase cytochrome b subunit